MFLDFLFKKKNKKSKKIGLVLGGGGARSFYQIGVIKALRELNIEIGEVSGTSMGAVIGAMYCYDKNVDFDNFVDDFLVYDFVEFLKIQDKKKHEKFLDHMENIIKKYVKARNFRDFKIPFSFNATDIDACSSVVFRSGKVFPALLASMSLVGFMPPVLMKGSADFIFWTFFAMFLPKFKNEHYYKNRRLVDGGVLSFVPVSCIKSKINILALDVSLTYDQNRSLSDLVASLMAVAQRKLFINDVKNIKKSGKNIFILHLDDASTVVDFRKSNLKRIIEIGYNDVMKNKNRIMRLIK